MRFLPILCIGLCLFMVSFSACEKDNITPEGGAMPEPMTVGSNQVYCRINGAVYKNRPNGWFNSNLYLDYSAIGEQFNLGLGIIDAFGGNDPAATISVAGYFSTIGTYSIKAATYGGGYLNDSCTSLIRAKDIPLDEDNYLKITRLDHDAQIISGKFAFVLVDTICQDTIRVTEGWFDHDGW